MCPVATNGVATLRRFSGYRFSNFRHGSLPIYTAPVSTNEVATLGRSVSTNKVATVGRFSGYRFLKFLHDSSKIHTATVCGATGVAITRRLMHGPCYSCTTRVTHARPVLLFYSVGTGRVSALGLVATWWLPWLGGYPGSFSGYGFFRVRIAFAEE